MFGDFYSNHKKIGKSEYNRIENGTPIVRLSSYYPYYKFGIYCNGGVIQQTYCRNLNVTIYESTSFKVFIAGDNVTIFEYTPSIYTYNKIETLNRAKSLLGVKPLMGALSVFGDDFVFWCMVGEKFDQFFRGSKMGRHFKTPYREGLFKVCHHAIAIEQDVVVHFHDEGENGDTSICFSYFSELGDKIIEIPYKDQNLEKLLIARNRAIFAWANQFWGNKYSIATNNCEHFATWCKTGEKHSKQVQTAIVDLLISSFCLFVPRALPIALYRLKKYF